MLKKVFGSKSRKGKMDKDQGNPEEIAESLSGTTQTNKDKPNLKGDRLGVASQNDSRSSQRKEKVSDNQNRVKNSGREAGK
ncbi:MAG: hypothetical protein Q9208_001217 [Pyrenodesmia sp. 3 TL-2023]